MIALISQIGITMLSSVFICGLVGYLIDNRFGTHIFLVTLILGIAGGYRAVYALIQQFISTKDTDSEDDSEDTMHEAGKKGE
jgi:F0F1-type ATP synthase assembly protein I